MRVKERMFLIYTFTFAVYIIITKLYIHIKKHDLNLYEMMTVLSAVNRV